MEILDLDLELELDKNGNPYPPKNDKTLLIDADTLAYTSALQVAEVSEVLPKEFYTPEEWDEISKEEGYNAEDGTLTVVHLEDAVMEMTSRLEEILKMTGASKYELHFTKGRESFRYAIYPEYKANRRDKKAPVGLYKLKEYFVTHHNAYFHTEIEADDAVVAKYNPEEYILTAIDKDVLYSVAGRHFNYYASQKYNKQMKFIDVDELTATQHHFKQTLTGDTSDNIKGLYRVGEKTAQKILEDCVDEVELWKRVVHKYKEKDRPEADAILNMRLVNMHQVHYNNGKFKLKLWEPFNANT